MLPAERPDRKTLRQMAEILARDTPRRIIPEFFLAVVDLCDRADALAGWATERGHYPHCPNYYHRPGPRPCDPRTCGLAEALEEGGRDES